MPHDIWQPIDTPPGGPDRSWSDATASDRSSAPGLRNCTSSYNYVVAGRRVVKKAKARWPIFVLAVGLEFRGLEGKQRGRALHLLARRFARYPQDQQARTSHPLIRILNSRYDRLDSQALARSLRRLRRSD